MSEILDQYIETALWSSTDDDGAPMDRDYSRDDIDAETLDEMENDLDGFMENNAALIERAIEEDGAEETDIAHNFWLTRNGHGAGFWDGDYPATGDALTEASKKCREYSLYIGDDDQIYGGSF